MSRQTDDQMQRAIASWDRDAPDPGSLADADLLKDQCWQSAMTAVREFAATFGWPATLRMVAAAMAEQGGLFK